MQFSENDLCQDLNVRSRKKKKKWKRFPGLVYDGACFRANGRWLNICSQKKKIEKKLIFFKVHFLILLMVEKKNHRPIEDITVPGVGIFFSAFARTILVLPVTSARSFRRTRSRYRRWRKFHVRIDASQKKNKWSEIKIPNYMTSPFWLQRSIYKIDEYPRSLFVMQTVGSDPVRKKAKLS